MDAEKIGKIIAHQRMKKHLTQQELADKLKVTNKAVSNWERGRAIPDVGLFDSICHELDLTLNELLDGKKGKSTSKGLINYLKYYQKKNFLLFMVLFILVVIFFILLLFFINNYNKTLIYTLYGESTNFDYKDGLLIYSNQKNILSFGKLNVKNNTVSLDMITDIKLVAKDKVIAGGTDVIGSLNIENTGYNELLSREKFSNLNDWYIQISYLKDHKINKETINLKHHKIMQSNKLINSKSKDISVDGQNNAMEYLNEEDIKLKNKLLANGFTPYEDNPLALRKSLDNNALFIVTLPMKVARLVNTNCIIVYEYDINSLSVDGIYNQKNYNFSYFPSSDSINCNTKDSCPPDAWFIAKNFLNLWNDIIE